jgi:hypothetical protein
MDKRTAVADCLGWLRFMAAGRRQHGTDSATAVRQPPKAAENRETCGKKDTAGRSRYGIDI